MGRFHLPMSHQPAMPVPHGGACCANCRHYIAEPLSTAPYGQCGQPDFARFYGTTAIGCPPEDFCSDWYEPSVPTSC